MNRVNIWVLVCIALLVSPSFSQNDVTAVFGVSGKVNTNSLYRELRGLSSAPASFSGDYAQVSNLVLNKDRASFTLRSGEIYFLAPVQGRSVGAVFIGEGEMNMFPPTDAERKSLANFTGYPNIKEPFTQLVMFFTDQTVDEIKKSPNAKMLTGGAAAARARDAFREKETVVRKQFRYNIYSRILSDLYTPPARGYFTAFIDGKNFVKLNFELDPRGIAEIYPEQVQLQSYAENNAGSWAAFHLQEEYEKGTGISSVDRRTYDILHHDLDTTIQGTRLTVKDIVTLKMRVGGMRFLPFDLFRTLRVKSVRGEDNNELEYIQENKDEDADFGVILPQAAEAGKTIKLTIEYDGLDALDLAGKGNFILDPEARSTWYPNNPNSSFGDRANFDCTFRYPKKFILVGVGDRVGTEQAEGDTNVAKWSTGGTEVAVAGFNYGDFKQFTKTDEATGYKMEVLTNKVLPDEMRDLQFEMERLKKQGYIITATFDSLNTADSANEVLVEAQNATRIYDGFFGKLPYKRIAMTQQPAGFFGQAWPTLVFMPYFAFFNETHRVQLFGAQGGTNGFWREVAPHEVAHQWWGHIVGWSSYRDQWMSEGFSEFSSSLYIQYVKKDIGKFNEFWEGQRKRITEATPMTKDKKPYTIGAVTQGYRLNSAKTGAVAQNLIYPKGGYILHMLRMMMYDHKGATGDARFRTMMNDLTKTFYNRELSTEDFKQMAEKHMTPEMNAAKNGKLDWFFDQWVYGTDVPEYKVQYVASAGGDGKAVFNARITQSGVSENFISLVPLYMDFGKGWRYIGRLTLIGNTTLEMKNVPLGEAPKRVSIDAYKDILNTKIEVSGK